MLRAPLRLRGAYRGLTTLALSPRSLFPFHSFCSQPLFPLALTALQSRPIVTTTSLFRPQLRFPTLPLSHDGGLDIQSLVVTAVQCFNKSLLKHPLKQKEARVAGFYNVQVPEEHAYQLEFYRVLKQWFADEADIVPEVRMKEGRADFVITFKSEIYVVELVATESIASVVEHIDRACRYGAYFRAREAWVVNFTVVGHSDSYVYPSSTKPVSILHINQDCDCNTKEIYVNHGTRLLKCGLPFGNNVQ